MKTSDRGFTLVELMITLAVIAIITTIALPAMRSMIQNNRITTYANEVVAAINLTRSEAVKRGSAVSACRSGNQTSCVAGPGEWANGWIIFDDPNNNGTADGGETLIRVRESLSGSAAISGPAAITYLGTGLLNGAAAQTFNLSIPGCTGNQKRTITVSVTGRPTITKAAC